jgi:hypothetical protein
MSNDVQKGRIILNTAGEKHLDRRQLIRSGLQVGAALGIPGLAGLTVIGGPGTALAQEDPTIPTHRSGNPPSSRARHASTAGSHWPKIRPPCQPGCNYAPSASACRCRIAS